MEIEFIPVKRKLSTIALTPGKTIFKKVWANTFRVRAAIPDYGQKISEHYAEFIGDGLADLGRRISIPFDFSSFGLIIHFDKHQEINLYDSDFVLDVKEAIRQFGPLILRNAYMSSKCRSEVHRNIFPDLNFHIDRGSNQENQYSLYCRDPFDPVQKAPRASSTLLIANIIGHLQAKKEGQNPDNHHQPLYTIFSNEDLSPLFDKILLHQPWAEPEGTGEICVLDNSTVLHASYYRERQGYPHRRSLSFLIRAGLFLFRDRPAIAGGEAPYYAGAGKRNAETGLQESGEGHDAGSGHVGR